MGSLSSRIDATVQLPNDYVTNAMVAAGAAIVDTKLATISTAGKIAASALPTTVLFPVGAIIPIAANLTGAHTIPATGTVDSYGYQYCDGAVIPGGQTLIGNTPDLTDGRFLRGSSTAGGTGGAATQALLETNVPSHTHAIDHNHGNVTSTINSVGHTHDIGHDHGTVTSGNNSVGHTHSIGHDHGNVTSTSNSVGHTHSIAHAHGTVTSGTQSANHTHGTGTYSIGSSTVSSTSSGNVRLGGTNLFYVNSTASGGGGLGVFNSAGSIFTINLGSHGHTLSGSSGSNSANHTHSVPLPNYTGNSGGVSANHTHDVNLPPYSGTSGAISANHTHDTDIPAHVGSSGSVSANHTHDVDLPAFTGTSGTGSGSGTAFSIEPTYLNVVYLIKVA